MENEKAETGFAWHRPKDVATSIHLDFTAEATADIGAENVDLLASVDSALNAESDDESILSISSDRAEAMATEWIKTAQTCGRLGTTAPTFQTHPDTSLLRRQYLFHLAYLHEIAYRRTKGPAMFERKSGVTPCPDFLPCTRWQVPASRFGLYTFLNRLWNWGSVLTIPLVFPLLAIPLFMFLFGSGRASHSFAEGAYGWLASLWALGVASFAGGFFACRALRGRASRKF